VTTGDDASALRISLADAETRQRIYRLRHEIFAGELGQHAPRPDRTLSDPIDDFNIYIVAQRGDAVVGFVSVTPPGRGYSFEKYFAREQLPFALDDGLYEIRLLSVTREHRGSLAAGFLMYAALRRIGDLGGKTVAALGRKEVLDIYLRVGLISSGLTVQAGRVSYILLSNSVADMFRHIARDRYLSWIVARLKRTTDWRLPAPGP
jgi:predicted GNAT family N-acyltransferase